MKRIFFTSLTIVVFTGLIVLVIVNTFYRSRVITAQVIHDDIMQLKDIFERIDRDCEIQGFDYQQNRINFLNVATFVGSEVGPMNLTYTDKWQGPYMQDNPTVQGIEYLIVQTENGYFITPGIGVKLPNSKIIGKEIILDSKADIARMMTNTEQLLYKDTVLAARLAIRANKQVPLEKISTD